MADVELVDLGDLRDRPNVVVVEAVPRGAAHAEPGGRLGRVENARELALALAGRPRFAVPTGVELDPIACDLVARLHLIEVRVDEERDDDVSIFEVLDHA